MLLYTRCLQLIVHYYHVLHVILLISCWQILHYFCFTHYTVNTLCYWFHMWINLVQTFSLWVQKWGMLKVYIQWIPITTRLNSKQIQLDLVNIWLWSRFIWKLNMQSAVIFCGTEGWCYRHITPSTNHILLKQEAFFCFTNEAEFKTSPLKLKTSNIISGHSNIKTRLKIIKVIMTTDLCIIFH